MDDHEIEPDDDLLDAYVEDLVHACESTEPPKVIIARSKRTRFWIYFVLGTALTGTALTVLIGGIVINEQAKIKQVAPEKPDKQYPYEIDVGTLTKEECEKAGYRFTEMGLGLPNGELLNPGPNVRRVILRRNGGGEIVCILDARSRAE
ncbi:hypothetical protein A3D88_00515 [Candidatus Peribacteria bacterium RIFCSPHIGHO2_02_FULL_52_16]|nr:MAG: hypothetical protein A2706_01410 [Candidatus Peribacteria bacterium RIFCSPHIGHO2_01_FULL_51_35]OGJ61956.1 MAG: hypothetical protein A3D88_00515 [Candidatus Peribacteria bacterium RIFCSPHIGHO2_02_FULL_52_16]